MTSDRAFRYRETVLPPEALELLADVLLISMGRDDAHPAYSETELDRKRRRTAKTDEHAALSSSDGASMTDIAGIEEMLDEAGLSDREKSAWTMHFQGYRVSEIARCLQVSWPTVSRLIRSASYRLRSVKPGFHGFSAVYYSEVHRHIYRKPNHCLEQPCRRLGYCRYAHIRKPMN